MENIDLNYICTAMGNLAGVPIRLYEGEKLVMLSSIVPLPVDPISIYWDHLRQIRTHVGYFVTPQFSYYGIINSGKTKIVLGPTQEVSASRQELRELAFQADVPAGEVEAFVSAMGSIVRMPLESVLQMLCTVNYILNGEKLELQDVSIYDAEQEQLKELLEHQRADRMLSSASGDPNIHNTYALEQEIMDIVRRGDTAALAEWTASAPAVRGGILASEQLRQVKNLFIVTATLVSRAAIQGGLDTEEALSLSDAFIQRCELLGTPERITNLQYHMILTFTERVDRIRLGRQPTRLALEVSAYVRRHLSEPVRVEALAQELYISRPHLSQKFREETGETPTDFILKEKTEEAKRLLRYTDKSSAAIGTYLGFSSQGHFSRVFKKYVGCTSSAFREKYRK